MDITKLAIAAVALYVGYKYIPNQAAKAMILGVAGVVVAKNTPVLNQYIPV